jgi:hypothetical protein
MKKTEYAGLKVVDETSLQDKLDSTKHDEQELPKFSKDVPEGSRKKEGSNNITVEYWWKKSNCENVHFKEITYKKTENLEGIFRLNSRDGSDSISLLYNNAVYIFRRTSRQIAKAIYNTYSATREGLENIVGWATTVLGNYYIISKVEKQSWSFDKRLVRNGVINYIETDSMDEDKKKELFDLIIQNIATLHSSGHVLGNFTLNSLLLLNDGLKFTDLRGLREARRLSYGVEEFKSIMQYLFAIGLIESGDAYYSIALYHGANELACEEWYSEKTGIKSTDDLEVTNKMEEEIF